MLCQFCGHAIHAGQCLVLTNNIQCVCVNGRPGGDDAGDAVGAGVTCDFCGHAIHSGVCGVIAAGATDPCPCTIS